MKLLAHHALWKQAHPNEILEEHLFLSHLCGQSKCGLATHILKEERDMNESRKFCHKGTWTNDRCPHEPPCIFDGH
jgi:hypothetical protein